MARTGDGDGEGDSDSDGVCEATVMVSAIVLA
jgi:hypothetical protein